MLSEVHRCVNGNLHHAEMPATTETHTTPRYGHNPDPLMK